MFRVKDSQLAKTRPLHVINVQLVDSQAQWIPMNIKESLIQLQELFVPAQSMVLPNFPNPFNPETWIPYQLSRDSHVTIAIYDLQGHLIGTLDIGQKPSGYYLSKSQAAYWDGRSGTGELVSSGLYFYHLKAGDYSAVKRMLILK